MENLEDIEGVGEGEKVGGIGGKGEEEAEGSSILRWNGVGEAVHVVCDSSVCLSHAQVRHCSASPLPNYCFGLKINNLYATEVAPQQRSFSTLVSFFRRKQNSNHSSPKTEHVYTYNKKVEKYVNSITIASTSFILFYCGCLLFLLVDKK